MSPLRKSGSAAKKASTKKATAKAPAKTKKTIGARKAVQAAEATAKKAAATKKPRAPKEVRRKAVWVVFDNASKRVGAIPYSQKPDAEALLASKQEEKKGTFYISLVKEPMEG